MDRRLRAAACRQIIRLVLCLALFCGCTEGGQEVLSVSRAGGAAEIDFSQTVPVKKEGTGFPIGGAVSHHLLAAKEINTWFAALKKKREVSTFIIISPRHYEISDNSLCMTLSDWHYKGSTIKTNRHLARKIMKKLDLADDPRAFYYEHGIGALLPFINHYFPNADIVTILIDEKRRNRALCRKVAAALSPVLRENDTSFLLLSADFSHDADIATTLIRDNTTRKLLLDPEPDKAFFIHSDNTGGLAVLFSLFEHIPNVKPRILFTSNSAVISGEYEISNVTSYFFVFFSIPENETRK